MNTEPNNGLVATEGNVQIMTPQQTLPNQATTAANPSLSQPNMVLFIADSYPDFLEWKCALENFVVQTTKIQTQYNFSEKLGEGTFGQVILGLPKMIKPPANNNVHGMVGAGHDDEKKQLSPISAISIIMEGRDASGMIGNINLKTPTMAKVAIKILNK